MPQHEPPAPGSTVHPARDERWVVVGSCACVALVPAHQLQDYYRATQWCAYAGCAALLIAACCRLWG